MTPDDLTLDDLIADAQLAMLARPYLVAVLEDPDAIEAGRRASEAHQQRRDQHQLGAHSPAHALHMSLVLCAGWMNPTTADDLAEATITRDADTCPLPPGASRDDAIKALSGAVLNMVLRLPAELAPKGERPDDADLDEWAARSAADDGGTDAGILWLSERLAAKIEAIGTNREAARGVADLWRDAERKRRGKVINGLAPRGYLFTGWGITGAPVEDTTNAERAEVWPPRAWRMLARALWRAEVRPPLVARARIPSAILLFDAIPVMSGVLSKRGRVEVIEGRLAVSVGRTVVAGTGGAAVAHEALDRLRDYGLASSSAVAASVVRAFPRFAHEARLADEQGAAWVIETGAGRITARHGPNGITSLDIEGGLPALRDAIGSRSNADLATLRALLDGLSTLHIEASSIDTFHRSALIPLYETTRPARGRPARVVLQLGPAWGGASPHDVEAPRGHRRIVPVLKSTRVPEAFARQRAALEWIDLRAVAELVDQPGSMVRHGGAAIPWETLAKEQGATPDALAAFLAHVQRDGDDGPARWRKVSPKLWTLADNDETRAALAVVMEGANRVEGGRAQGRAGNAKRTAKITKPRTNGH
jgi:hypothetical protein